MKSVLYIVVPCYNEEESIQQTGQVLCEKLNELMASGEAAESSRILFVDDGSKDSTWNLIAELCDQKDEIQGIKLAHNKGHQNALIAGLMTAKEHADIAISTDADLQDDVNAINEMIEKYHAGADIVYGVRNSRKKDSFFKRSTAHCFYKMMKWLGAETVYNHADFRLMSKRALEALAQYKEVNLFLRGIVPMLGFQTDYVYYERGERTAGESKYPLRKMMAFAWEGITSLSITPIRFITSLGTTLFVISLFMMAYSVIRKLMGATVTGWSSIAVSLWMIGGLVLLSIGIVGEYIGKIYLETKARPRYIVEEEKVSESKENEN